jgi:hypothetical protein
VPYFSGRGGVTPPGGNIGAPGSLVDFDGDGTTDWFPDLARIERRLTVAMLVKM